MPKPMECAHLRGGPVVPVGAYKVVLAIENAGHRLRVDGDDIVIEPGLLDAQLLEELHRWKAHAKVLLAYVADDSHLRDPIASRAICRRARA